MSGKKEGLYDRIKKSVALGMAVEMSRDENGKPDPYKAAGIARGMGHHSMSDAVNLGIMLHQSGGFDDESPNKMALYLISVTASSK